MDPYNNFNDFCKIFLKRDPMYTQGTYNEMITSLPGMTFKATPISTYPVPAMNANNPHSHGISGKTADMIVIDDYIKEPKQWFDKKKGTEPMRYENNAIATVAAPKSDIATQREYLLTRLQRAEYKKSDDLRTFFNLYVDNTPKTPQALIDAIKENKYTIDTEKFDKANKRPGYYGFTAGIIWDGPKPDQDGYDAGVTEMETQKTAAKDAIMVFGAEDGLKAVQAFEAWMPEGKPN